MRALPENLLSSLQLLVPPAEYKDWSSSRLHGKEFSSVFTRSKWGILWPGLEGSDPLPGGGVGHGLLGFVDLMVSPISPTGSLVDTSAECTLNAIKLWRDWIHLCFCNDRGIQGNSYCIRGWSQPGWDWVEKAVYYDWPRGIFGVNYLKRKYFKDAKG